MSPGITEEIIARQPPEAQAIIRALLAENAELKARIEALERQAKSKTPQNSSLPPSSQHPHARPQPPKRRLGALGITIIYMVTSGIWILVSDDVAKILANNDAERKQTQTKQGVHARLDQLTPLEKDVLNLIVQGQP